MLLSQWQLINCQVKLEIGAPGGSDAKESAYSAETQVRSLCCKDPLEKEWATHSSILSWRIPWMEEPNGLQPIALQSQTQLKWLSMHTYMLTKVYSFTNLKDSLVASKFWKLWIKLLQTSLCKLLYAQKFSASLDKYQEHDCWIIW